jgi:hypothetical protein
MSDSFVEIVNSFVERLWMVDIKMKIGDLAETAIDINVEGDPIQQRNFNLPEIYQLLVIPEHLASFQRCLRFWH